ncbi:HD-GYP domain-containing protein [Ramlibacter sp. 2FC]|uniref:HD-GYP domain-containing protein n=1 Tax=Ramlibacter sp. 2FC TaxID=2502188 RepID=UPI0014858D87|nr:HD-GYP domain-containing protein [Ramlibacter sp. 2FC]
MPYLTDNQPIDMSEQLMLRRQSARYAEDLRQLREQRNAARHALKASRLDALLRLAAAVEHKDSDTGAHIVRMGHYSAAIAQAMGQPAAWCEVLLYASRLHDIGKIAVPDRILQKAGPLSEEERRVMRSHPQIGASLLAGSDSPLFEMAAEVALQHHEQFDGAGYPDGRRGQEIALSARIVAVADCFDALTSDRCYRPAMPDELAFRLLREGSGRHFDPAVLSAFFGASRQLLELREAINAGDIAPRPVQEAVQ